MTAEENNNNASEKKYTDEEISHVAVEIGGRYLEPSEEMFYVNIFDAWLRADWTNKCRLRPVLAAIIAECGFENYFNYEYGVDKGRRMVEECMK